jgi:hypothetical protein
MCPKTCKAVYNQATDPANQVIENSHDALNTCLECLIRKTNPLKASTCKEALISPLIGKLSATACNPPSPIAMMLALADTPQVFNSGVHVF